MSHVLVIGGGLGGLTTSMLLALDGHRVTVLERDPASPPADVDDAWQSWERRGVGQFRMLHLLLPRWRELAERELPSVVSAFEGLGALRYDLIAALPAARLGTRRPGDDRFVCLTGRRPTIEAAVAAAAGSTSGLEIRRGVGVAGLLTGDECLPGVPHVVGVRTDNGEDIGADLVIDAGGRRSLLPDWLAAIGAQRPAEEIEDSGFVYYGRHFRSSDGTIPECLSGLLVHRGSVSSLTLPADNGTWGVGIIASSGDRELRGLRSADRWHAAVAAYPDLAHWADAEPISEVTTMSKIEDRRRRFVVDGRPVATGVAAVADAWACTNPSLGRGASIGLMHSCALRDLLRDASTGDPLDLALRWDEVTEATVAPWYELTLAYDRSRLAEMKAAQSGEAYEGDPTWAITSAFASVAGRDPDVCRAFLKVMCVFETPAEVMAEPGLFDRILELAPAVEPLPELQRDELVDIAAGRSTRTTAWR